jgi:tRNA pseudouridine38-40 synthase
VLPDDIRICNVTLAPESVNGKKWHATSSALGKYYSYTFCTNKYVDPMLRRYCGHMYFPIDIDLFKYSLSLFKGTHNFAAFSNHVDRKKREFELKDREFSTFKTIHSIDLIHLDAPGYYRVDIQLNSALYRMIRNIIWTCGHVAHGRMTTSQLEELLVDDQPEIAARSRNTAKPAPPEGLCLEKVYYEHFP